MSESLSDWIAQLSSDDVAVRRHAAENLSLAEEPRAALIPLVRATGDQDEDVRELATSCLENVGTPDEEEIESLIQLLRDPSADVVYWAVTMLGRLESSGSAATDDLIQIANRHDAPAVQQRAVWALGRSGVRTPTVLECLQNAASSSDPRLARLAQQALE